MSAPVLEILAPLRAPVVADIGITALLGTFNGAPSVHTCRPIPVEATYPMVVIGPIIARGNEDGINDFRPVIVLDMNTYGEQDAHFRTVDDIADRIYRLFHRQRRAITVQNYSVIDITCTGPSPAPVDDASRVGRRVTLTIRLYGK